MSINDLTHVAAPSALDLFSLPATQFAIISNVTTEHRPFSTVTADSALTFQIEANQDEYVQLKDMMLFMKIQVNINKTGAVAGSDWANISPVNYLLNSMFKQIDVEINGKPITTSPQTYPYKAMIETLVGFTNDARKSYLTGALWYADNNNDNVNIELKDFVKPSDATSTKGRVLDLMGKLHIDLAMQERALLGGSVFKLNLVPHDPQFYLMCKDLNLKPSVHFLEAKLFVQRAKVSPSLLEAHTLALQKASAKYPISRNEVKTFLLNSGGKSYTIDNVVHGQMPRRAFVGFVSNAAFNGKFDLNPFNFKNLTINSIASFIDGIQYPSIAYTPDFSSKAYVREYLGLFEAVNQLTTDSTIGIDRKKWASGKTLFAFNFAPDSGDSCVQEGYASPTKRGSLGIQLRLDDELSETINVIVYLEFDNLIQIDSDRQVITDFI